ncbi:MAG TPA: hypothetical protein VE646_06735 [Actinomycetota bacterium]|jgi:hypothetical protein|nr:hypothetical protein [Actinomycetota bacterium]
MGILDKVKEAAGGVAEVTKKGAAQVQTKVHLSQLRSRADDAAKRLGYLIHKERTEGTSAAGEVEALVAEITDLERQIAEGTTAEGTTAEGTPAQGTPTQGTPAQGTAPGTASSEAPAEPPAGS